MGFGPLLIGYFITFIVTLGLGNYLFAGMLIGGFIMFLGLSELRKYAPTFLYAIIANILLVLCSFYETVAYIDDAFLLEWGLSEGAIANAFSFAEVVIYLIFNLTLLYGIADLSRRVEYPETRWKAFRNMSFVVVYNLCYIAINIPNSIFSSDRPFFLTLLMILQIIYALFNVALIFKCYAMICPEGEEEMTRKPSRFEFINKLREKQDEREQAAIESNKDYLEKKIEKRNQKKNSKHKKKK